MTICDYTLNNMRCGKEAEHSGAHLLVAEQEEQPPTSWLLSDRRMENPEQIAGELRKALQAWDDWEAADRDRAAQIMMTRIGDGESPREAFRVATLDVGVRSKPVRPQPISNTLARKIKLRPGDHHLIARLSKEWGDSYTAFVRSILEGWAANHRMLIQEHPEMDLYYDPAAEDE